jgi:DNA polymerase III epsilon subunit-like protein
MLENGPCREDLVHQLENISLQMLAMFYNLEFREAHHALEDAFLTARLWQKQLSGLEAMRIGSLTELLRIARA